jgi:hypothetical protein
MPESWTFVPSRCASRTRQWKRTALAHVLGPDLTRVAHRGRNARSQADTRGGGVTERTEVHHPVRWCPHERVMRLSARGAAPDDHAVVVDARRRAVLPPRVPRSMGGASGIPGPVPHRPGSCPVWSASAATSATPEVASGSWTTSSASARFRTNHTSRDGTSRLHVATPRLRRQPWSGNRRAKRPVSPSIAHTAQRLRRGFDRRLNGPHPLGCRQIGAGFIVTTTNQESLRNRVGTFERLWAEYFRDSQIKGMRRSLVGFGFIAHGSRRS